MKVAILDVSPEVIKALLCTPNGFEIIGITVDPETKHLYITVQSDTFPETHGGQPIPNLQATVNYEFIPGTEFKKTTATYEVLH